ncbi:MAG: thiamine pyrophosphate-binding protein [Pseudomonadota bacterium]
MGSRILPLVPQAVTEFTVSDLIAAFLEGIGAETAFGVVSVHNIPVMDAISRRNRIRLVSTRGEAGAAHMADGHARAGQRLGVLITSTGPGAANACGGLYEAWTASTPLLHITGQSKTAHIEMGRGTTHETQNQLGMLRTVCKGAFRIRTPSEAMAVLTQAAALALTAPMGPVSIEVPADIQRSAVARPVHLDAFQLQVPPSPAPRTATLERMAGMVRTARRPVLWLGSGARQAETSVRALIDLGFACVSSWHGRGLIEEDHSMSLGAMNGGGIPLIEEFYESCDLMIVAGSRLRGHETVDFSVKLPAQRIQVDVHAAAQGRTYPCELFVQGDVGLVLTELCDGLGDWRPDPAFAGDVARVKERARNAFKATLGPYSTFAEQLQPVLDDGVIFARDVTINHSTWGHRLTQLHAPHTNIYPVAAGIGQGLSLAIGAALTGQRTLCMTGDGGFMLNVGELWTAIQENADLTILVMNDAGYGVIRHIQDATGAGRRHETLVMPDLADFARTAGLPFWRVSAPEDFGAALAEAVEQSGPTLVEVDMTAIGPHPPYFPYGPKAEAVD